MVILIYVHRMPILFRKLEPGTDQWNGPPEQGGFLTQISRRPHTQPSLPSLPEGFGRQNGRLLLVGFQLLLVVRDSRCLRVNSSGGQLSDKSGIPCQSV